MNCQAPPAAWAWSSKASVLHRCRRAAPHNVGAIALCCAWWWTTCNTGSNDSALVITPASSRRQSTRISAFTTCLFVILMDTWSSSSSFWTPPNRRSSATRVVHIPSGRRLGTEDYKGEQPPTISIQLGIQNFLARDVYGYLVELQQRFDPAEKAVFGQVGTCPIEAKASACWQQIA
mmetsp:Transcript_102307/g.312915  ORF Transcript_102307/g.312915 Transcript_102307/m.312915 type:complete len:177 (-) Transcript_102307:138-668(-)